MLKLLGLIKKNFGEDEVTLADKTIIWDLDNTLYRITPEFADMLDEATAIAAIEDLGVPLNFEEAKAKVKESYMTYRDGGEIFVQQYGIDPEAMFQAYHKRKPIAPIVPYENLLEKLESLPNEQYIFSTSTHEVCEKILKHIGLYDFFKGRFYSVEDFGTVKKNESSTMKIRPRTRLISTPLTKASTVFWTNICGRFRSTAIPRLRLPVLRPAPVKPATEIAFHLIIGLIVELALLLHEFALEVAYQRFDFSNIHFGQRIGRFVNF